MVSSMGGKILSLDEKAYDANSNKIRDTDLNRFLPQFADVSTLGKYSRLYII
jgi:iron complex outermembrane receptor protein